MEEPTTTSQASSQRLTITKLALVDFRNISQLEIQPAERFNVISGDNGQGKTSLLEALYFLATTKSFRSDRVDRLRKEGQPFARVDGDLLEGEVPRVQRATLTSKGKKITLDGATPERLSHYATRTPIIVFHPGDLTLTMGGASPRRDLLDRVSLFSNPSLTVVRSRYRQALKERQKVLELRGENAPELEAYETLIALHGAQLTQARQTAAVALSDEANPAFRNLVVNNLSFEMSYQPGGSNSEEEALKELHQRRSADRRRHMATFGPHRDDLLISLDGRAARQHASQGQHRILTLTLKLAELAAIRAARGAHPLLLLDDVSSELDPTRIGAVYDFLNETSSQVFVTTTRPELFHTPNAASGERRDFHLHRGQLQPLNSL